MRKSKIAAKLRQGKPIKLAMMHHYIPAYIAYAAHEGYDGLWLDMEHRPYEAREVQALLAFCHLYDIDCLVRPFTRERAALYRLLEDGASGLIMPHVSDIETARALAQAAKFPPLGDRGLEGNGLETNYGIDIGTDRHLLVQHALQETLLAIQIETPQGLEIAEEIAALPGVDMLYVGPSDLGLRLAQDSALPSLAEATQRVAEICRRYNKPWGSMPRTLEDVKMLTENGAQLIVWGNEQRILRAGLQRANSEMDEIFKTALS